MAFNAIYGRLAMAVGCVFIVANVASASMNFYLGSGGVDSIDSLKISNIGVWCIIFLPYYTLTEYVPACVFAFVMFKYGEIFA